MNDAGNDPPCIEGRHHGRFDDWNTDRRRNQSVRELFLFTVQNTDAAPRFIHYHLPGGIHRVLKAIHRQPSGTEIPAW